VFEVWDSPLDVARVVAAVSHGAAGAVDVFLGVVRDHSGGRAVTRLDYEAYKPMAVAEMKRIADEIAAQVPGVRLAAAHRVGELAVGELAVVCAASAPHRAEAFDACRRLIDQVKARVPVWKREWGPDGPYWVGWEDARCTPGGEGHAAAHGDRHHAAHAPAALAQGHVQAGGAAHEGDSPAARAQVRVATITVSDTRSAATDRGGETLRAALSAAGYALAPHAIVPDEPARVREAITRALQDGAADAVVTTGGTGIAPRDQTYEAVAGLLEKHLDGFGEAFRQLSWEQIGARALLSRAVAGTYRGALVAALPGSPRAVQLGVERVLAPVLWHAVALAKG
jgi:molybdenum cofactor synthesis domain-containing protein